MRKTNLKQTIANKIFHLIENAIEHHLFKPVCVSIITSFILFNGFVYFQNDLKNRAILDQKISDDKRIKINIPDSYYDFNLYQNQVENRQIKSGDTLLEILLSIGVKDQDVFVILTELRKVYKPSDIKVGDVFTIKYQVEISYPKKANNEGGRSRTPVRKVFITSISFNPVPEKLIEVIGTKNADGTYSYSSKETVKKLTKRVLKYDVTVNNGLYVDGTDAGISPKIMLDMIGLYSFDIDFQRDIRGGDQFEVLFESYFDEDGNRIRDGEVLFASIKLQKIRTVNMYLHKTQKGGNEYFDSKGSSVRKSLLRTPVNGARISSRFGRRRHPVLGYTRIHKGIDFAAPTGTPIFAAGSGTITKYGRNGSFGNYVQIRHNNEYSTAYAHASRFARGLRVGSRVSQGQIVAYVGTTGRSTGPHLHYEIHYKGRAVNPSSVRSTSGLTLKGNALASFMVSKAEIDKMLRETPIQNK